MVPPTLFIEAKDFHNAWARAIRSVLRRGDKRTIGNAEHPKKITDACAIILMTGNAIKQIEAHEIHSQYPFKHITQYCEGYTREYLAEYITKPEEAQFSYLYFERLVVLAGDQIKQLKDGLKSQIDTGISSNRMQAITWSPGIDQLSDSPPCLQRIWIRYIGNQEVEVHLTWRSRDAYSAWQSNVIALVDMVNREIVRPNGCKIVNLLDFSNSFHIYDSDVDAAELVTLVSVNPQLG